MRSKIITLFIEGKTNEEIAECLNITLKRVEEITRYLPKDNSSKGEKALREILKKIYPNQRIEEQKYFYGQYFDFYIPSIRVAIEYDGQQHFEKNSLYHRSGTAGHYDFERGLLNDKKKDTMANKEYICVIRIPYTTELTETKIRNIFNDKMDEIISNLSQFNSETGI